MTAAATAPVREHPLASDLDCLTIAELAVTFKVCERTIERRIHARDFPVVRIAGGRRIPRAWVADLIATAVRLGEVVAEDHGRAWIAAHGSTS
jgi:hypothetical protein